MRTKHNFFDIWKNKKRSHATQLKKGSQSPVGNQDWVKKFAIGMKTDLNGNDLSIKNELHNKYMGNCKRKAKLPSRGAGKGILWPENDGNKI